MVPRLRSTVCADRIRCMPLEGVSFCVKSVNVIVKQSQAFKRILKHYMYTKGCASQAELQRWIEVLGYPFTAGGISMYLSGKRRLKPEFLACIAIVLKLNRDQEDAVLDAYFVDLNADFLRRYFEAKARLDGSDDD